MKAAALSHSGTASVRGEPAPADLEVAAASLVSAVEREIFRRRALIDQIQERVEVLRHTPGGADAAAVPPPIDSIVGSLEVRGFLKLVGDACREEALILQSTDPTAGQLPQVYEPLLARGVTVRIICQHRSRADLVASTRIRALLEAGASMSTVSHVPRSAVVFDRSVAALLGPDTEEASLARVHSQVVVQFLLDLFNHLWESATPLQDAEPGYADVADDLQQAIARLMAKGYTDEVVARKLGMSVRSCRRHIAALMRDLDATSRFQAGVQAAQRFLPEPA